MTVSTQLKQTLAALKSAQATIINYSLYHPDKQLQALFKESQGELQNIQLGLEKRIQQVEFEEPQFKGN